jgi:8-oxo-dGTP pyrophosphatase MutT (NUDIX family)
MPKKADNPVFTKTKVETLDQISAGGVAFRWKNSERELVVVSVKPKLRWQLPKGLVDPGESPEITAVREVKEEGGVETERLGLIETIEYWYRSLKNGKPVRFHKFVHFYLSNHDHEVEEARWVSFEEAIEMLEFKSEREVVEKAREMIEARGRKGK